MIFRISEMRSTTVGISRIWYSTYQGGLKSLIRLSIWLRITENLDEKFKESHLKQLLKD